MAASPGNRKRRSTDSAITCARRMISSPIVGEATAKYGLLNPVSTMNRNNSSNSLLLPVQLTGSNRSEGFWLAGASSSDLHVEPGAVTTDDDFPSALATSWLTMTRCLAPLRRVLLPEARHILTSAVRLMSEDIMSLLMQKVQQALASAPNRDQSASPVLEDEGMPSPGCDDMEETPKMSTASTSESMDWEIQQAEQAASVNSGLNVNLYMASINTFAMPVQMSASP